MNFRVRWILSCPTSRKPFPEGRFWAARNNASLTSCGGKTATNVLTAVLPVTGFPAVLVGHAARGSAVGDQGRRGTRSDAVVYVDDREPGGASLEHTQDGGCSVTAEAVAGGGRKSHDRYRDEAGDHARQRALHPRGDDQAVRVELSQFLERSREAVKAGHADIVEAHHGHAHLACDAERLFEDGQVGGAGAQGADTTPARCGFS